MRDSLTILAILLIGVLTAALVGPYVVDWNSQRGLIERRLSQAAGVPVTVSGPIDVKLLPTPRLRFGDVAIGDARTSGPRLEVGAVEAEISLTALLRGQVQIVDTTLVSPRLDLDQAPDGTIGPSWLPDSTADRVAVDHLGIRDGSVILRLADGRRMTLAKLDVDGEAASLRGPFKVAGLMAGVPFRLVTGTLDQGHMRVKLHVDGGDVRPAFDGDGTLVRRPGGVGPGFDGTATLAGSLPLDGSPATVPWSLTAHVSADRDAATASDVELRAGTDLRALIARGEGTGSFAASATPTAALQLHGASLDLDALAVAPADGSVAPPTGWDIARPILRGFGLADGARAVSLPLRLDVALGLDTATIGGRTLLATEVRLGLGPEPTAALALSAEGPQGARLSLDGRVDPGPVRAVAGAFGAAPATPAAMFRGRAELRSSDLGRTAAWLAPVSPDVASALAGLPGPDLHLVASVEGSATGIVARDVSLALGGSRFAGLLSFNRAVGTEHARFFADLTSEMLALDRMPDLSSAAAAVRDLDLDVALASRAITLSDPDLTTAAGHPGPVAAGHLALHLTKSGDDMRLSRLAFDVDGASVEASAERTGTRAAATVRISAPQIGPLVQAFGSLMSPSATAPLRNRAAALSPLDATLSTEGLWTNGGLDPERFALVGTARGTHLDATLTPVGSAPTGSGGSADRPLILKVRAEAPDAADLLHQLDLPVPGSHLGTARIDVDGRGSVSAGFSMMANGAIGPASLAFQGRADASAGSGRLTVSSPDIGPVAAGVGPGVGPGVRADVVTDIAWQGTRVELKGIQAQVADLHASGILGFDLQPKRDAATRDLLPSVGGALTIDRLPVSILAELGLGAPAAPAATPSWSTAPFLPAPTLPPGRLSIKAGTVPLRDGFEARDVGFDLSTRSGAVTLSDLTGTFGGGRFGGALTLRHDNSGANLSGRVTWADVALDVAGLSGTAGGREDFAAAGGSPAALVASLAGSGSLALRNATLARTDPTAIQRTLTATSARDIAAERASGGTDVTPTAPDALLRDLSAQLDAAPLRIGNINATTTLVGGTWRIAALKATGPSSTLSRGSSGGDPVPPSWSAETTAGIDIGALTLATRADLHAAPASRAVDGPEVVVTRSGPFGGIPTRAVDAAGLVAAVQAQAIARAQERIDVVEQDIRERAAFNRQLKALRAEQQAAKERADAERQAALVQAAADAKARADAARAAVELQRAAAARQKVEDARIQAQIESAARAAAAAEKQRFIDKALKASEPPLDTGGGDAPLRAAPERRGPRAGDVDPPDPSAAGIMR